MNTKKEHVKNRLDDNIGAFGNCDCIMCSIPFLRRNSRMLY